VLPVRAIDIYFWTVEDAQQMLAALKAVTSIRSLRVDGQDQRRTSIASDTVVGRLENIALSSPVVPEAPKPLGSMASLPPPPANTSFPATSYNPAAPAAPEAVVYRAKTPPPPDGGATLTAALGDAVPSLASPSHFSTYELSQLSPKQFAQALRDDGQYFNLPPPPAPPIGQPVFLQPAPKTPPSRQLLSFDAPPTAQSTTPQHLSTLFSPPTGPNTPASDLKLRSPSQAQAEFPSPQYATYRTPPEFPPKPPPPPPVAQQAIPEHMNQYRPAQMYSPGVYGHIQAQASPGYIPSPGLLPAFGSHSQYGTPTASNFPHGPLVSPHNIHSQAYRPTEAELGIRRAEKKQAGGFMGAVDAVSEKTEKKVGKWLKRVDKRL
jgi:hypothetical protein